jgi:hypothetical protein
MDSKESNNITSKIMQNRYARILGFDRTPPTSVLQTKKRKLLRWVAWFLVLLILVLVTRYLTNIPLEVSKGVKLTKSGLNQKQAIPSILELKPLPNYVASIADTIISEQKNLAKLLLKMTL